MEHLINEHSHLIKEIVTDSKTDDILNCLMICVMMFRQMLRL
jgi:hypothetical protein